MFSMASLVLRILRQIAHHQVVARLALQHLSEGVAAHGGLDGVLNVRDVDLIARGLLAVHREVIVRLAQDAKHAQILNSLDLAHDLDDLVGLVLENVSDRRRRPWWPARPLLR